MVVIPDKAGKVPRFLQYARESGGAYLVVRPNMPPPPPPPLGGEGEGES